VVAPTGDLDGKYSVAVNQEASAVRPATLGRMRDVGIRGAVNSGARVHGHGRLAE
jgi:hypothetical protein